VGFRLLFQEVFPKLTEFWENLNFIFFNPRNGLIFSDISEEIYTLELSKVPAQYDGSSVWEWLRFLRSKQREEFEMAAKGNTKMVAATFLVLYYDWVLKLR